MKRRKRFEKMKKKERFEKIMTFANRCYVVLVLIQIISHCSNTVI